MSAELPCIHLWNSNGVGLIILCPSGVRYSNQTGGYACLHPVVEGVYVPLSNEVVDQEAELAAYFSGTKWLGWCNEAIDEEAAAFVDEVLRKSPYTKGLVVNRDRLLDSHESWIYVIIPHPRQAPELTEYVGFGDVEAILTWENGD